jgi:hypothetical protein
LTIVDFSQLTEKRRKKGAFKFQTKSLHQTSKVARIEGDIPHAHPACPSRTPAIAPRPLSTCCPRLPTDQPARAAPADTSAPGTAQHYPSPSSRIRPPSPPKEGPVPATKCRTAAPRTEQSNTQLAAFTIRVRARPDIQDPVGRTLPAHFQTLPAHFQTLPARSSRLRTPLTSPGKYPAGSTLGETPSLPPLRDWRGAEEGRAN